MGIADRTNTIHLNLITDYGVEVHVDQVTFENGVEAFSANTVFPTSGEALIFAGPSRTMVNGARSYTYYNGKQFTGCATDPDGLAADAQGV
jgi:hypothetical protein